MMQAWADYLDGPKAGARWFRFSSGRSFERGWSTRGRSAPYSLRRSLLGRSPWTAFVAAL